MSKYFFPFLRGFHVSFLKSLVLVTSPVIEIRDSLTVDVRGVVVRVTVSAVRVAAVRDVAAGWVAAVRIVAVRDVAAVRVVVVRVVAVRIIVWIAVRERRRITER